MSPPLLFRKLAKEPVSIDTGLWVLQRIWPVDCAICQNFRHDRIKQAYRAPRTQIIKRQHRPPNLDIDPVNGCVQYIGGGTETKPHTCSTPC